MSALKAALSRVVDRFELSAEQMDAAMTEIMGGNAAPLLIGAFLSALRTRGETVTEIAAAARVLRRLVERVELDVTPLLDIVGTGGDGASTFNVSTASAFVAAEGGAYVAKHGNRAVSSKSGAADVLEAAGVNLELPAARSAELVRELRVGFLFAPRHHQAMRHAAPIRRELGLRTLFNLLGPLSNPAFAPHQVLGVYARAWLGPLAEVMRELGSRRVLVVHAEDGLDEISLAGVSHVAELDDGRIRHYQVQPEDFGIAAQSLAPLRVESAAESLALIRAALGGQAGPAADMIALNAGAALYAAELERSISAGVKRAQQILASGAALKRLEQLAALSQIPS
jgi:anthranilate phosphoribosyltransferase